MRRRTQKVEKELPLSIDLANLSPEVILFVEKARKYAAKKSLELPDDLTLHRCASVMESSRRYRSLRRATANTPARARYSVPGLEHDVDWDDIKKAEKCIKLARQRVPKLRGMLGSQSKKFALANSPELPKTVREKLTVVQCALEEANAECKSYLDLTSKLPKSVRFEGVSQTEYALIHLWEQLKPCGASRPEIMVTLCACWKLSDIRQPAYLQRATQRAKAKFKGKHAISLISVTPNVRWPLFGW